MTCDNVNWYFVDFYIIFVLLTTYIITYVHSIGIYEYGVSSYKFQR